MDSSAGDPGDAGIHVSRRRDRAAAVELAAAAALRLARGHLLASARASGAVPDPLRWIRLARVHALQHAPPHAGALRAHDPGGAGTVPATHARALGLRPIRGREHRAMTLSTIEPRS